MQLPVLGCTFLTLSEQQGLAPIIRAPAVPPTSTAHKCPAMPPTCAQQCHPPVPISAHQCHPSVPISAA
ncbi:unnamed protein product [Staurois parvus]|uniref:Uncharacterized protein n=1 Tax=Staurois parvus TaxID=386267 RepID=A0ABN9E4W2_9NEOB|nr:unnamed protein product [Staurois parvus]